MAFDVALAPLTDYSEAAIEAAMDEVLEASGGLGWVTPGMRVAIKPNLCAPKRPEEAVCTHPALVADLTKRLVARGAHVVIGESPAGLYNHALMAKTYASTGMTASRDAGAELNDDFSVSDVDYPEAVSAKHFTHTAYLDHVDAVITFAKLKTHGMMGMTAAVKNLFGTIPGTMKLEYHYAYPNHRDFANMLVDICEYHKPRLALVDAVIGMDGNGPTAGTPKPMGFLMAGANPHKVDLVAAKLLGIDPHNVPTLAAAMERGLVSDDISSISVHGDIEALRVKDCRLIPQVNIENLRNIGDVTAALLRLVMKRRPSVTARECIGCGKCASLCPARAITMVKGKPRIDRTKCICCFCCQEFCPRGAMKVHRTLLARLLVPDKPA